MVNAVAELIRRGERDTKPHSLLDVIKSLLNKRHGLVRESWSDPERIEDGRACRAPARAPRLRDYAL
jgi:hypothetical protein